MNTRLQGRLRSRLRRTFGFEDLRPEQRPVVDSVMAGDDTIAVMPTGSGKSLCYQLPALELPGLTLVLSPLIALMKDQADKLQALGVDATAINSTLSDREIDDAVQAVRNDEPEFLFVTPERLNDPEFMATLAARTIDLVVIDEAHCISQWGHDFRPAYAEISQALHRLGSPQVLALTATATSAVIEDIKTSLERPRMRVINAGVYRSNLRLAVKQVTGEREKMDAALDFISRTGGCGIVYCATVKATEEVRRSLTEAGEAPVVYNGRLSAAKREAAQEAFMTGRHRVMVATNAFGMGIDKPDIRFILHFQIPGSLEAYYQEAGRAGRDGADADCLLLYDHSDRKIQRFFLGGRSPDANLVQAVHRAACDVEAQGQKVTYDRVQRLLHESMPASKVRLVLSGLRRLKTASKLDRFDAAPMPEAFEADQQRRALENRQKLERVSAYAFSARCRWNAMLEYFQEAVAGENCGHCDNCLRERTVTPRSVGVDAEAL